MKDECDYFTLSAQHIQRNYGARIAVYDFTLQLKKGEVLGLLGPNGAGKTTALRMITGNLAPSSGSIEVCGVDLLGEPQKAKAHIGYLPEIPPLYLDMTVNEYLRFAARLHRIDKQRIAHALEHCKQRCGLADRGKQLIGTMSKGLQQRVGIAQAIIHEPDIIILDEPTVGLDPNQMREMRALIRDLGKSRSVILSTHILSEVESVCDRVQIMHDGRMVLNETLAGLRQKDADLEMEFTRLTQNPQPITH
ncbi:ABC-2 type transport system ATP-binding protein [Nitrosomonas sp. Nm51]|uniref:ABC transporter ATP-binding protein n=1 Tax=Nitrosomonas sp. Nm51 TaxID=133720 RepID=UPI0008D193B3|nr:ABC transporter ATP-binding protein [Nitrosomonas sp. Nm51]SER35724.1 ABC-2 type transport system ATP-binding protein [Nitrosomonas sp. Nm51]